VQEEMEKGSASSSSASSSRRSRTSSGRSDADQAELNELRTRFASSSSRRRLQKVRRARAVAAGEDPSAAAEHGVIRTYLDWLVSLPWNTSTEDNLDLKNARAVLDSDHYDLEKSRTASSSTWPFRS
jgi:ATP-dependent Lon protease